METQLFSARFHGAVKAETIDHKLADILRIANRDRRPSSIEFDFSRTSFIEPVALQMVIAWLCRLKELETATFVRIPESKRVRDFWRAWGFPQAVAGALGANFKRFVRPEDHIYFGERQEFYRPERLVAHPEFGDDETRSMNFFGFYTMVLNGPMVSTRQAYEEQDYWKATHIQSVLKNKLGKGSNYFASRVVFEAILNAMRHPGASRVQTAAFDQTSEFSHLRHTTFAAHFWDDGMSMAKTLSLAINRGVAVRGQYEPDLDRKYLLVYSEDDQPTQRHMSVQTSRCELDTGIEEYKALFATLFPSVSSDPAGKNQAVAPDVLQEDIRYGRPGMGLYVLVNAVAEVLGGTVSFRTGPYFMFVRKPNQLEAKTFGVNLRVRIKRRSEAVPDFLGNLVIARLPSSSN